MDALRVLDLTDELARSAARTFVGLGAEVVRVAVTDPDPDLAAELHWHAGSRVVPVTSAEQRREVADRLAAQADVVVESGPVGELVGVDVTSGPAVSRWPDAIHVVVTPFGLTGPRRDWRGDGLVAAAAGGMAFLGGRADAPPAPPPRDQAAQLAGAHAVIGALLAALVADRDGCGQLVDISAQEAVAATVETAAIAWIHAGRYPRRTGGVYEHVAHRIFAASDGYVAGGYSGSPRMWTDLLAWLVDEGAAEDLTDERFGDPVSRWAARPHVDAVVARFAAARRAADLADEGRRRALPWAEVVPPGRLLENPQLRERDYFLTVVDDRVPGGAVQDVGPPVRPPGVARAVRLDGPRPVAADTVWATGRRSGHRATGARVDRPLDGVRVLDLTWVLAGPYATKTFADFGADVIKVESVHRHDPTRVAPGMQLRPGAGPDDSGYFINFNRGKRSIALNLRTEAGVGLLQRLAAECDVVIENFSPGMLARWGLTYAELAARRPGVTVVSMAGVGQTGPWRDAVTFADTLAAMSGLSWETRDQAGPPQGFVFGLGDMVAANAAVTAVLERLVTGRGGYVDLSQLEAMAATLGPAVLEAQLGAAEPAPGPRGVFPAAGDDRWIAISVTSDAMWRALAGACPQLAELRGIGRDERRARQVEIAEAVRDWTRPHDPDELAELLQQAGVAAAAAATGADLVDRDPQLAARGFYVEARHEIAGVVRHEGIVERLAVGGGRIDASAPLLGQHTDEILRELAGLADDEIARLRAAGVLE